MKLVAGALILCLLAPMALAQATSTSVGVGAGAAAVDPSKNVLDALLAAVTRLNDLMVAAAKRSDDLRKADNQYQTSMREAETRRVDQLGAQKQVFDLELARINRANADASALLLASQVKELKTDSAERMGKLEEFANQQRGRSSGSSDTVGWIAAGVFGVLMLLVAIAGLIFSIMERGKRTNGDSDHEREDAERYRRYVERKVADSPAVSQ
jgi:hypothetical protein